ALVQACITVLIRFLASTPRVSELRMDWRALAFAILASLCGAAAFGLLPALRSTSARQAGSLFRAGRGIAGRRQRAQSTLVAGQIALTMLLLATAGLLLRSFQNLTRVDLGFDPHHALIFHVGARWDEDRTRGGQMQEKLIAELQGLPGIQAAGMTNFLPASGATLRYEAILEGAAAGDQSSRLPAGSRTVSPGYLKALQAPLLGGSWCPEL